RSETAENVGNEPVPEPELDPIAEDPAVADVVIEEDGSAVVASDSSEPMESVRAAEQAGQELTPTLAVALGAEMIATQADEIDFAESQVESDAMALSSSDVVDFTDEGILSQASILDLEGLAQFLDVVPTQSLDSSQSLAEIVEQFLSNGPKADVVAVVADGSDVAQVSEEGPPDVAPEILTAPELPAGAVVAETVTTMATQPVVTEAPSVKDVAEARSVKDEDKASKAVVQTSETIEVAPELLVGESSVVVATGANTTQKPSDTAGPVIQSPVDQSRETVQAPTAPESPNSTSQDEPQPGFEEQSQDAVEPQVSRTQAPETARAGSDPIQQVRVDQSATPQPAAETQRTEGMPESIGRAAQRLVERIETLRNAPPPRSMVLELTELAGTRVRVSLDGNTVRMTVMDGSLDPDAREQLDRELSQALAQQGFDLSRGSEEQRERWEEAQDQVATVISGQRPIRVRQATGLRL
ncbi:MAG: hypothetical protein ACC652_09610, partial [Acidimicrobiales bacterium]